MIKPGPMRNLWPHLANISLAVLVSSCQPTVKVEVPKEPITINLNVKLDADVRAKLEEQAVRDVRSNPDVFGGGSDTTSQTVKLLSRSFLPRGTSPDQGYGFYAYLLFPRNLPETRSQRLAAAKALFCLLGDVAVDRQLVSDLSALAVLYVPISSIHARTRLLMERDPYLLLDSYDYSRARLFSVENDLDLGGLYVVGQIAFFSLEEGFNRTDSQVFEFSRLRPEQIFSRFASLEDSLIANRVFLAEGDVDLFETWRTVFRTLGEFVLTPAALARPAEAGEKEESKFVCP